MSRRLAVLALLVPAAAWAGARASNFKKEHNLGTNTWNAQAAIDGDPATAWMLPGDSPMRGEWLMIDLPKGKVDKLRIMPGWQKDEETFKDHARPSKLKIEYLCCTDSEHMSTVGSETVEVPDGMGWKEIDLENVQIGNELFGGALRMSIVDLYPGKDYPNLAISEVMVVLEEFDANTLAEQPGGQVDGHPFDLVQDDNPRTFWAAPLDQARFVVPANGFGLSSIGILPGPKTHARPKTVRVTVNERSLDTVLEDKQEMQYAPVPSITGYNGSGWGDVQVQVIDTWPGTKEETVAIAEVQARATNYEGL